VLLKLTERDSAGRLASAVTGEWMYIFKPVIEARMVALLGPSWRELDVQDAA